MFSITVLSIGFGTRNSILDVAYRHCIKQTESTRNYRHRGRPCFVVLSHALAFRIYHFFALTFYLPISGEENFGGSILTLVVWRVVRIIVIACDTSHDARRSHVVIRSIKICVAGRRFVAQVRSGRPTAVHSSVTSGSSIFCAGFIDVTFSTPQTRNRNIC